MTWRARRRKTWIKVPLGRDWHNDADAATGKDGNAPDGKPGVEYVEVSVSEPPLCCGATPPLADPADVEGDRVCGADGATGGCGSRWLP